MMFSDRRSDNPLGHLPIEPGARQTGVPVAVQFSLAAGRAPVGMGSTPSRYNDGHCQTIAKSTISERTSGMPPPIELCPIRRSPKAR